MKIPSAIDLIPYLAYKAFMRYLLLLAPILLFLLPLRAQDNRIIMTPELALTFPFLTTKDGVTVKYPVLINTETILQPGYILYSIYLLPHKDGEVSIDNAHQADIEKSFTRDTRPEGDRDRMPPELAQVINSARKNIWTVPNNFQLALAQYPIEFAHLIYNPTGKSADISDQGFNFLEGLFVGSPTGKVTVLAVEDKSRAHAAGIKAGDEIVSIEGTPINQLSDFPKVFIAAKHDAREANRPNFSITLHTADGQTSVVKFPMPPNLSNGFMESL